MIGFDVFPLTIVKQNNTYSAMAGNRTRVNCLEGSYAHHYTTIASLSAMLIQESLQLLTLDI